MVLCISTSLCLFTLQIYIHRSVCLSIHKFLSLSIDGLRGSHTAPFDVCLVQLSSDKAFMSNLYLFTPLLA